MCPSNVGFAAAAMRSPRMVSKLSFVKEPPWAPPWALLVKPDWIPESPGLYGVALWHHQYIPFRKQPGEAFGKWPFSDCKNDDCSEPLIERDETGGSKNPIPKGFQRIFHWLLNFTTNLSQNPRILDTLKIRPLIISFSYLLLFSSHPSNPMRYN